MNPLIWIANKQLRQQAESACDDCVVARGIEPQLYASYLVEIGHASIASTAPAIGRAAIQNNDQSTAARLKACGHLLPEDSKISMQLAANWNADPESPFKLSFTIGDSDQHPAPLKKAPPH